MLAGCQQGYVSRPKVKVNRVQDYRFRVLRALETNPLNRADTDRNHLPNGRDTSPNNFFRGSKYR